MFGDGLAEDTHVVAGVEARDDHTITLFVEECCGETLVTSTTSTFERIETYCVHRLDALAETLLDAGQIGFELATEFLQLIETTGDMSERVADMCRIDGYEEFAELEVHPDHQAEKCECGYAEDDETDEQGIGRENIHGNSVQRLAENGKLWRLNILYL